MKFQKDQRVSHIKLKNQKGKVINISIKRGGYQYYEVVWDKGDLEMVIEHDLQEEIEIKTAWDIILNNKLSDYRDFSISSVIYKVKNTTINTISSLKASKTIFKAYQYKPLVKFLKSESKRILIADEVGLGKTIEAGHILLEQAARGKLNNALIICSKSIQEKWQTELKEKFNFDFKVYLNTKDFIQDLNLNQQRGANGLYGIINYDKCRSNELQQTIIDTNFHFDMIVCDEAHHLRNPNTDRFRGASTFIDNSEAVVMLTATPIMTELSNLYTLVKILEPRAYFAYDVFKNAINQNKPFIKALTNLNNNQNFKDIAIELENGHILYEIVVNEKTIYNSQKKVSEVFSNDRLYQRVIHNLKNATQTTINRVSIQNDLLELNSLNNIYTRTRKKDVLESSDIVTRVAKTIRIELGSQEQQLFDSVIENYQEAHSLALVQKKRQISSSIVGFLSGDQLKLNNTYNTNIPDSKFKNLQKILKEVLDVNNKKIIIFSFFTNTLLYLNKRLGENRINTYLIYGNIKDRDRVIENFKNDPNPSVLLSSEIGSEGIDLQFCDALVNYDLPWNPMVVEQRIGRIDRVGQKSPIINIYNFVIKGSIEETIHDRLYRRINLFEQSLGDLEDILGEDAEFSKIEKTIEEIYRTELTKEEINERLDRISYSFEMNKQTLKKVKGELEDAFANDFHFQNEINIIEKNNRYISNIEIISLLESAIRIKLPFVRLKHLSQDKSIIEFLDENGKKSFFEFVEKYYQNTEKPNLELQSLFSKFKRYISENRIEITFNQKYAFENKKIEYVSAFHPLVNAITNYFIEHGYHQNQAFKIALNSKYVSDQAQIEEGFYILSIFKISITKDLGNESKNTFDYLKSCLIDLNQDEAMILPDELSDIVYANCQLNAESFTHTIEFDEEFINQIRPHIMIKIKEIEETIFEDEKIKFISSLDRRNEQELLYLDKRIKSIEDRIETRLYANDQSKSIISIEKNKVSKFQEDIDTIVNIREKANISVSNSLISVNILQIL